MQPATIRLGTLGNNVTGQVTRYGHAVVVYDRSVGAVKVVKRT